MEKLEIVLGNKWKINGEKTGQVYSLFGYYDVVSIKPIEYWHQFRPAFDQDAFDSEEGEENNIHNMYTIRLFRDSPDAGGEKNRSEEYPIFACVFFHCSDNFLQFLARGKHQKWVEKPIVAKQREFDGVLKFWRCIGYFDYALILYAPKISTIVEFIDKIKAKHKPSLFSSSYTILGYNEEKLDNLGNGEKISAKMEFSFGKDVSYKDARDAVRAFAHRLRGSDASIVGPQIDLGKHDWHLDCREITLKDFLINHRALCGEQVDLPKISSEERMRNALTKLKDVKTGILFEVDAKEVDFRRGEIKNGEEIGDPVKNAFGQFRGYYVKLKNERGAHVRPLHALEYLTELYRRATESRYGKDVVKIIGNFFISFLTTLSAILDYMQSSPSGVVYDGDGKLYNKNTYVEMIENGLNYFRDAVEPLLVDILKSDCGEFENLTTNHFSIGSATKLLFAYNATVAEWEEIFVQWAKEQGKEDLTTEDTGFRYLITSGGVDTTKHLDFFDNNHEVLKGYFVQNGEVKSGENISNREESSFEPLKRPIIVFASEGSLYDVKGTLLRLAHEFFHKRGNRIRMSRARNFYINLWEIFFEYCKNIFPVFFLNKEARRFYEEMVQRGKYDSFNKDFNQWKKALHKKIEDQLFYEKPMKGVYEEAGNYLSNIYPETAFEVARKAYENAYLIHTGKNMIDKIAEENLKELANRKLLFGNRIYDKLGGVFMDELSESEDIRNLALELFCAYSKELKQQLPPPAFFNAYSLAFLDNPKALEYRTDWDQIVKNYLNEQTLPFIYFLKVPNVEGGACDYYKYHQPFTNIVKNLASLYKECYADCMAIIAMGLNNSWKGFLQYIFCFLFEKRNINELFYRHGIHIDENKKDPIDFETYSMRIGVVTELCWRNIVSNPENFLGGEQPTETQESIVKTIEEFYRKTLYPSKEITEEAKSYAKSLCDKLLRILLAYKKWKAFKYFDGLIKYLDDCIKENNGEPSLLKRIGATTDNVFGSEIGNEDESYIDFIMGKWLSLFEEEKKGKDINESN